MNHELARELTKDILTSVLPEDVFIVTIDRVFDWNVVAIDVLTQEYNDYLDDLMDELEETLEETYMILLNTHSIQ